MKQRFEGLKEWLYKPAYITMSHKMPNWLHWFTHITAIVLFIYLLYLFIMELKK